MQPHLHNQLVINNKLSRELELHKSKRAYRKNKKLIVVAREKEKLMAKKELEKLNSSLRKRYSEIIVTYILLGKDIPIIEREIELKKIWKAIRGAEVAITDRYTV